MVNHDAIPRDRHDRVTECVVQARVLSRARVVGYIIAGVSHDSSRGREYLAAPARGRRVLVGIVFLLCIVLIQAAQVYSKLMAAEAAMAAVRDPVLPDNAQTTKGNDERCLLLV